MCWFRRCRSLDLRTLSELHDGFANRRGAEALLAEAEEYLAHRERTDDPFAKQHTAKGEVFLTLRDNSPDSSSSVGGPIKSACRRPRIGDTEDAAMRPEIPARWQNRP